MVGRIKTLSGTSLFVGGLLIDTKLDSDRSHKLTALEQRATAIEASSCSTFITNLKRVRMLADGL